jgi:YD repeat-containing protein
LQLELQPSPLVVLPSSQPFAFVSGPRNNPSLQAAEQPSSSPRKVFMTESRDPQGNALKYTYDAELRLVAVTDAIGQVTTLSYEDSGDPLKITRVTDPFGRFATFEYDGNGRLASIVDVIGLRSSFEYEAGDFISAMTTPYGTTRFHATVNHNGETRTLEATDPLGGVQRLEFWGYVDGPEPPGGVDPDGEPAGFALANKFLGKPTSYYWSKRAMAAAPGDYAKAVVTNGGMHLTPGPPTGGASPLAAALARP